MGNTKTEQKSLRQKQKDSVRYCFASDGDGHDYIIPVGMRQEFSDLLEDSQKQDDYDLFNIRFDKYRCNCHPNWYSFTDPKEIDK